MKQSPHFAYLYMNCSPKLVTASRRRLDIVPPRSKMKRLGRLDALPMRIFVDSLFLSTSLQKMSSYISRSRRRAVRMSGHTLGSRLTGSGSAAIVKEVWC